MKNLVKPSGDGAVQNVERVDATSTRELIVRTQTLADVNINH